MMTFIPPELPQSVRYEAVPAGGWDITVRADSTACEALAKRMKIPAVLECAVRFALARSAGRVIMAEGWLQSRVVLTCVVTSEPFETRLEEEFVVRFVPAGAEQAMPDPDSIDEIPYEDGVLAIGEAAAEQLALALPAFPRGPDTGDVSVTTSEPDALKMPVQNPVVARSFAALAARRKPV